MPDLDRASVLRRIVEARELLEELRNDIVDGCAGDVPEKAARTLLHATFMFGPPSGISAAIEALEDIEGDHEQNLSRAFEQLDQRVQAAKVVPLRGEEDA